MILHSKMIHLGILIIGCKEEGAVKVEELRESVPQLKPMSELRGVKEIKAEGEINRIKTTISINVPVPHF